MLQLSELIKSSTVTVFFTIFLCLNEQRFPLQLQWKDINENKLFGTKKTDTLDIIWLIWMAEAPCYFKCFYAQEERCGFYHSSLTFKVHYRGIS